MPKPDDPGRRIALKTIAALAACPLLSACEFVDHDGVDDFELADSASFDLSEAGFEDLADIGGKACMELGSQELLLVRTADDEIVAFDRYCPHDNRDMGNCGGSQANAEWDPDDEVIVCQWHNSAFRTDGENTAGPANEPIQVFPVQFDADSGQGTVFRPT